jgi:hypothetical protein
MMRSLRAVCMGALLAVVVSGCAQRGASHGGAVFRPDLDDNKLAAVQRGESAKKLIEKFGEPWRKIRFAHLRATAWDYRYTDTFGFLSEMSFMVDDEGFVKESIKSRIQGGKDDR